VFRAYANGQRRAESSADVDPQEKTIMKRIIVAFAGVLAVVASPIVAGAHNAGHVFLPDGTCLLIGSFRSAPLVGQDRTQLDLIPETTNPPFDEFGVSFVGANGQTPIFPGTNCSVGAPAGASLQDANGVPTFADISYK
jgi:hypothetical protein